MRLLRVPLLSLALAGAAAAAVAPTDAQASVSIAVGFDALVKDADAVAVVTPETAKSVWEDGRIYTYTKLSVEQAVAGDVARGREVWVRTMGGVVGEIGQLVDGEPVFVTGKTSLLFLRKFTAGTWEVSARAQGQYPVVIDPGTKVTKVIRSRNAGVILPPKAKVHPPEATLAPKAVGSKHGDAKVTASPARLRLAGDILHDRTLREATRDIKAAWKRLHPAPAPAK